MFNSKHSVKVFPIKIQLQIWLKTKQNIRKRTNTLKTFILISPNNLWRWKNMQHGSVVGLKWETIKNYCIICERNTLYASICSSLINSNCTIKVFLFVMSFEINWFNALLTNHWMFGLFFKPLAILSNVSHVTCFFTHQVQSVGVTFF